MNTVLLIIASVTLVAVLSHVYLEARRQTKPRIKVYFPNGSTQASYKAKEEANVAIHFKNEGRFGFPKPPATSISVFVYTPTSFLLKTLESHGGASENIVVEAPSGGIFGGMHYSGLSKYLDLFHQEEEIIVVHMQMPECTGKYITKLAFLSDKGDLGIHKLEIVIS